MNRTLLNALAVAALSIPVRAAAQDAAVPTTHPAAEPAVAAATSPTPAYHVGRLAYDRQCVSVDGHDLLLFSGCFHYFRCPKPLWADRFRTLKAAGFNTLETYVPWNWHEQQVPAGPDDTSKLDMSDLHDWLEMATQQFGFYVVLRPGPYICAEWDGGGYPQWLLTAAAGHLRRPAGCGYRSDDPALPRLVQALVRGGGQGGRAVPGDASAGRARRASSFGRSRTSTTTANSRSA